MFLNELGDGAEGNARVKHLDECVWCDLHTDDASYPFWKVLFDWQQNGILQTWQKGIMSISTAHMCTKQIFFSFFSKLQVNSLKVTNMTDPKFGVKYVAAEKL